MRPDVLVLTPRADPKRSCVGKGFMLHKLKTVTETSEALELCGGRK